MRIIKKKNPDIPFICLFNEYILGVDNTNTIVVFSYSKFFVLFFIFSLLFFEKHWKKLFLK